MFCHIRYFNFHAVNTDFWQFLMLIHQPNTNYVVSYFHCIPYTRVISLGTNFPEFPEWPCNLRKYILGVSIVQLWNAKEYYYERANYLSYLLLKSTKSNT